MKKRMKSIIGKMMVLALITIPSVVSAQSSSTIWGSMNTQLDTQKTAMKPLLQSIFGWAAVASVLVLALMFLFGSRENGQKAKMWAGFFVVGLAVGYTALALW